MKPFLRVRIVGTLLVAGTLVASANPPAGAAESDASNIATAKTEVAANNPACLAGSNIWSNNPTAQTEHSAAATAHKTLADPNNQLGTSLSGRTRDPGNCVATASAEPSTDNVME